MSLKAKPRPQPASSTRWLFKRRQTQRFTKSHRFIATEPAFLLETLTKFPTLTSARLLGILGERGYVGSASHLRHLVAGMRPRPAAEAYPRLRTLPGEQAQVDWGLCRARHRPHYAEFPNMPGIRPRFQ